MANRDLFGSRGQRADGEGSAGRKRVQGQLLREGPKVTSGFDGGPAALVMALGLFILDQMSAPPVLAALLALLLGYAIGRVLTDRSI